jgi:hypothetical protein
MKIQINDEVREVTAEEILEIENAIAEAQRLISIEEEKLNFIKSSYDKLIGLGLTPNEAKVITGYNASKTSTELGGN